MVGEEGKLYADTGDFRVLVPENGNRAAYDAYVGKEVTFGIRPEHVHAPEYAPPGIIAEPMQANTEVVELLGHEIHLFLNSGRHTFVATVDPRMAVAHGNKVDLVFDMGSMHLFDKSTNLAIR